MPQRAPTSDRWVSRTGRRILLIGLLLLAMWVHARDEPHGAFMLFVAGAPLTIIGAAITIAAWAFRLGPDPLRDPFGTGTEAEDSDEVRHN
jgi:hypothetical protein